VLTYNLLHEPSVLLYILCRKFQLSTLITEAFVANASI